MIRPILLRAGFVWLACGLPVRAQTEAADDAAPFPIKVRSTVDRPLSPADKNPEAPQPRLYAIAGIEPASKVENDTSHPLVMPVDQEALRTELKDVLSARGFHETTWGKAPDIVITVLYGRDAIANPADDKAIHVAGSNLGFDGAEVYVVHSAQDELGRERSTSPYFEKLKYAESEKLFIVINAWKYRGFNPTEKPKLQWRTVVFVDDPDRDLNMIAGSMLTAAGAYFDRKIEKDEVAVMSNALNGQAASEVKPSKVSRK